MSVCNLISVPWVGPLSVIVVFPFFVNLFICLVTIYICSKSTEPINAVNILPLARFERTTLTTPLSTTNDIDATNCATETCKKGC